MSALITNMRLSFAASSKSASGARPPRERSCRHASMPPTAAAAISAVIAPVATPCTPPSEQQREHHVEHDVGDVHDEGHHEGETRAAEADEPAEQRIGRERGRRRPDTDVEIAARERLDRVARPEKRKKPNAQNTNVKSSEPIATAPMWAAFGICPTTAVSTTPVKGPAEFASIAGPASVSTARCVSTERVTAGSLTGRCWLRRGSRLRARQRFGFFSASAGSGAVTGTNYGTDSAGGPRLGLRSTANAHM
jgi:hypothetical protein